MTSLNFYHSLIKKRTQQTFSGPYPNHPNHPQLSSHQKSSTNLPTIIPTIPRHPIRTLMIPGPFRLWSLTASRSTFRCWASTTTARTPETKFVAGGGVNSTTNISEETLMFGWFFDFFENQKMSVTVCMCIYIYITLFWSIFQRGNLNFLPKTSKKESITQKCGQGFGEMGTVDYTIAMKG